MDSLLCIFRSFSKVPEKDLWDLFSDFFFFAFFPVKKFFLP